jgi:serpin B
MRNTADYACASDEALGLEALSVPYKTASLLLLLPRPGRLAAVEQGLDGALFSRLDAGWQQRQVELHLPRFEFEWRFELSPVLRKLGLRMAFDAGGADFSGISEEPEGLVVSRWASEP